LTRKRKSLLLNGVLLILFVKLVMNPYPSLDDLSQTGFFVALNLKFVFKEVQALLLFFLGTLYALMNSGFLWITWLKRFSGNANFFYF
jgi:GPI transamidase subunit PIG-U